VPVSRKTRGHASTGSFSAGTSQQCPGPVGMPPKARAVRRIRDSSRHQNLVLYSRRTMLRLHFVVDYVTRKG
jgi:hypothetical protein